MPRNFPFASFKIQKKSIESEFRNSKLYKCEPGGNLIGSRPECGFFADRADGPVKSGDGSRRPPRSAAPMASPNKL